MGGRGEPLRSDHELALGAVAQDGPASAAAAEQLRSDHEFVLDAVMQDGPVVAAAAEQLRSDRALELGAVTQDGPALAAAAERLRNDHESFRTARCWELVALPNTIKALNDDHVLDLVKNTSPSASLLQMKVRQSELRQRTLARVRALAHSASAPSQPQNDFIALALSGKQIGFEKIIKMAYVRLATLKQEQTDGDGKLEHCKPQLDSGDSRKKDVARTVSDVESSVAASTDAIITELKELDALEDGIRTLDKSVEEATENQKKEHEEYEALSTSDVAVQELILFTKSRMQKFYKPPPNRKLTEEERLTFDNGDTSAPTAAPADIVGFGIAVLA